MHRILPWSALALTCACASSRSAAPATAAPAASERLNPDSVVVRITNRDDHALVVSLYRDAAETRLGSVSAGARERFAVSARKAAGTRVAIFAATSHANVRTVPFRVRGGQVVWLDVSPGLVGSRARVRWPEEGPPK